jgi:hypothetical protein
MDVGKNFGNDSVGDTGRIMFKLIIPVLSVTIVLAFAAPDAFAQRPRFPSPDDAQRAPERTPAQQTTPQQNPFERPPEQRPSGPAPAQGGVTQAPAPSQQIAPSGAGAAKSEYYGAIAFTADGSFSTTWKHPSKAEAEADVAKRCSRFGRGGCEIVSFSGEVCAALATYIGSHSGRRFRLSYTGGGMTSPDAQRTALNRCNDDRRSRGRCQLRTVVCGDGR